MKAPSPAFSLYPKDIESDERCKAMTHAEFGMYMRLLLNCWTEGSIPAEPIRLQRLLKVSARTFAASWPAIEQCFTPSGDRLTQSRLEEERVRQRERSLINAERGRKGGKPSKSTQEAKPRLSPGFTGSKPDQSLSFPSPFPSSITTEEGTVSVTSTADVDGSLDDEINAEERQLMKNLVIIRDSGADPSAVCDSLDRPKGQAPFNAHRALVGGKSGIPHTPAGLTVRRRLNDALEARQRAQDAPYVSDKNRISFDSIDRVLGTGAYADGSRPLRAVEGGVK